MIIGGVKKAAILLVGKMGQHQLGQFLRPVKPALVKGRLVKGQQPITQIGVIFQIAVVASLVARFPGAPETAVFLAHRLVEEFGVLDGHGCVIRPIQHPPGFSESRQHQAIPGSQHLVIQSRPDPFGPFFIQRLPRRGQQPGGILLANLSQAGHFGQLPIDVEDILALPVAPFGDVISQHKDVGRQFITQRRPDFSRLPDVKLTLLTFAVGVEAAIEAARLMPHLAHNVVQRFGDDLFVKRPSRYLPGV